MTIAGGVMALYVTEQTLNVSSLIGFIALFGIAIQNGVVLVGKINDLRAAGKGVHEAVIEGSVSRFRPILMTELILILGVLPLALGGEHRVGDSPPACPRVCRRIPRGELL